MLLYHQLSTTPTFRCFYTEYNKLTRYINMLFYSPTTIENNKPSLNISGDNLFGIASTTSKSC